MILRRVIRHFRNQEWTAIFLDFVIVVVGVFVGLQVQQWSEARAERNLEKEILANITEDIKRDVQELTIAISITRINIQSTNYALLKSGHEAITPRQFPSKFGWFVADLNLPSVPAEKKEEEAQRLWSDIVFKYYPTQSDMAFEALSANGRLGLIQDRQLVRELQAYRHGWIDIETSQNLTYRRFRDRTVNVGQKSGLSPLMLMPEDKFTAIVRQDKELLAAIRTLQEYSIPRLAILEDKKREAEDLLAQLTVAP